MMTLSEGTYLRTSPSSKGSASLARCVAERPGLEKGREVEMMKRAIGGEKLERMDASEYGCRREVEVEV